MNNYHFSDEILNDNLNTHDSSFKRDVEKLVTPRQVYITLKDRFRPCGSVLNGVFDHSVPSLEVKDNSFSSSVLDSSSSYSKLLSLLSSQSLPNLLTRHQMSRNL